MTTIQCAPAQSASTLNMKEDMNANSVADLTASSRQNLFTKRKRGFLTKLEVALIVLVVLLVAGFITTTVLLVLRATKEDTCSREEPDLGGATENAIESFSRIFRNMDKTIDPCKDFYQYACGGWVKKTFIEDSDVSVFPFKQGEQENQRKLNEILKDEKSKSSYSGSPGILKAFGMYGSCMNTTPIEKYGDSNLKALLSELGVFNITKEGTGYRWQDVVVKVKRKLNIDTMFKIVVMDDIGNSSTRRIVIRALDLGLSHRYYPDTNIQDNSTSVKSRRSITDKQALFNDRHYQMWKDKANVDESMRKVIRRHYLEYMVDLMSLVFNHTVAKQNMTDVLEFETKIAQFDWLSFSRNLTHGAGYVLTKQEKLLITSPKMVQEILILLNQTHPRVISNYIAWRVVSGLIDILPKKYGGLYRTFRKKLYNSDIQDAPRWSTCLAATSKALPLATALLFADFVLPPGTVNKKQVGSGKQQMDSDELQSMEIITSVREALLGVLPNQRWMDKKSQTGAMEKIKAMIFHAGYPTDVSKDSVMRQADRKFNVSNKSYFFTNLNVKSSDVMENLKSLKSSVARNDFQENDPLKPTAFYFPTRNKAEFSVGILNSPFYDIKNYNSLNFGAFGMVVGHEITHGFDLKGHNFDKNGRQFSWMSKNSSKELSERTTCFTKQLSKFKYQSSSGVNMTFNPHSYAARQAYSDTGGLNLAFEAYKQWKRQNKERPVFRSLNTSYDQLFFLSFAQVWCSKYKEREFERWFQGGTSLPFAYRVQGTVMNSPSFGEVFSCPLGSMMNPREKCEVW